jgi:hypothetical protein
MSRVKAASVVQSTRLSIMADYNSALFERYHLLFMDPTYGTGSEAVLEEKVKDYLETSLEEKKGSLYEFAVEDVALIDEESILDNDMERLKEQIEEYEKTAGVVHQAKKIEEKIKGKNADVESAAKETEDNAVELPVAEGDTNATGENESTAEKSVGKTDQTGAGSSAGKTNKTETGSSAGKTNGTETGSSAGKSEETGNSDVEVTDPRDTLKEALQFGILSFLKPEDMDISRELQDFSDSPSAQYKEEKAEEKDNSFQDIGVLKSLLKSQTKSKVSLSQRAALLDYVDYHFSNGVNPKEDSVMKCETEYILEGKDSDFENIEGVVNEIIWLRMPTNYAYLLTDEEKKSEALGVAAAICTATGTEAFMEVVKYLLLGCWAYGETLCDVRSLLAGNEIAYIKTKDTWKTDLKNLTAAGQTCEVKNGVDYEDYLLILLGAKSNEKLNTCYARMLDVMELNLRQEDDTFSFENCVGAFTIQGKLSVNSLFYAGKKESYEYYFEEVVEY